MFLLSFVLEDWAIHELVPNPRQRRIAVTLIASSYVTWTYQTHTFSNAIEALLVLWSLVMLQRIRFNKQRSALLSSMLLGLFLAFGCFNRATFPAFVLVPCLTLLPHFQQHPSSLFALGGTALATALTAIACDTAYYNTTFTTVNDPSPLYHRLVSDPVITPLNSLIYNTDSSNLACHGIHPRYLHIIANLPLLLGPALFLLPSIHTSSLTSLPTLSALSGLIFLSLIPHQEARFLLPIIPACLSSIRIPKSRTATKSFVTSWLIFNLTLGIIFGIFHQGGVVPAQIYVGQQAQQSHGLEKVLWWRTYSPPVWLLDHANVTSVDLMGIPYQNLREKIEERLLPCGCDHVVPSISLSPGLRSKKPKPKHVGLIAPYSSLELDSWRKEDPGWHFQELHRWHRHFNLDDLDFSSADGWGVFRELRRVIGRRGLVFWKVGRDCRREEDVDDDDDDVDVNGEG